MQSGMIGKIDKAHRYAQERDRFEIQELSVRVHGDNGDHVVTYAAGHWQCECDFFRSNDACAHTMALELVTQGMARPAVAA
ncbi:MAG: hypothetical protein O2798_09560 [Chloroflexi bacterium]|nr:hypothetical protein [Chloroflexota bacterium]MDA1241074.1 hypothetical protein [Chloroflexota bacterium]MQC25683.1 hypothetical protein [Chloroflexota bacterium]MQC47983.1 hypothetical protein [Chloroflexota bacterium]